MIDPARVSELSSSIFLASPKSVIFGSRAAAAAVSVATSRTFAGFRSRWMTPRWWA